MMLARTWWVRRLGMACTATAVILAGAVTSALVGRHSIASLFHGALLGSVAAILPVTIIQIAAPSQYLRFRQWMMQDGPPELTALGKVFDGHDSASGPAVLERRYRLLGVVGLVVGGLLIAAMWVLIDILGSITAPS